MKKENIGETSMGGGSAAFPVTTWGMLTQFQETSRVAAGLEALIQRYWKPAYRYIRIAWAKSNEDAKDLTQAFFLWIIEHSAPLRHYEPELASFRTYLKVLLKRFVKDREKAMDRLKRGGGIRILALDRDASLESPEAGAGTVDPEAALDRALALEVARRSIERVRERYGAGGRAERFKVYEEYDLVSLAERPTYASVAAARGWSETDVRHALSELRRAVEQEIRAELADLSGGKDQADQEWYELFGR